MGLTIEQEKNLKPEKSVVKRRGQVTIPKTIRDVLGLHEDDQLEVTVENGRIVMQPLITIAKDQAWFWSTEWQNAEKEAEQDIKDGNVHTFDSAEDALAFLHADEEK